MRYIGDVTFRQASEIVWTTSDFGLDQARIPYRGAAPLKDAFEAGIVKFHPLPGYARMYMTHISDDGDVIFPTIDVHYIGVRGTIPLPKITNSRVVQTVTTSTTHEDQNYTLEATYFASRTNYQWIETTVPPITPRYGPVQMAAPVQPFRYHTEGGDGGLIPYAAFVAAFNNLVLETVISEYTREEVVPGKIWQCEATADQMLQG